MNCPKCKSTNVADATHCQNCNRRIVNAEAIIALDQKTGKPVGSIIVLGLTILYLANMTAGIDILPDVLPLIGNLDEVGAVMLMLKTASNMGMWNGFSSAG